MDSFPEYLKKEEIKDKIKAVNSIEDINSYFDYKDDKPNGQYDGPRVSCGQNGDYNELRYIYDKYLAPFIEGDPNTTKKKALEAMCKACFDLTNPRSRSDFYNYIEKELDYDLIFYDHLKK
jgi:hypothetical protein